MQPCLVPLLDPFQYIAEHTIKYTLTWKSINLIPLNKAITNQKIRTCHLVKYIIHWTTEEHSYCSWSKGNNVGEIGVLILNLQSWSIYMLLIQSFFTPFFTKTLSLILLSFSFLPSVLLSCFLLRPSLSWWRRLWELLAVETTPN